MRITSDSIRYTLLRNKTNMQNSGWSMLDFGFSIVFSFIVLKLVVGCLGVDRYGFYTFFANFTKTLGLVDIGISVVVSKYLSEYIPLKKYGRANQVIQIGTSLYFVIGIVVFISVWLFRYPVIRFLRFPDELFGIAESALSITSAGFLFLLLNGISSSVLIADQKWKSITILNIIFNSINFASIIFIIYSGLFGDNILFALIVLNAAIALIRLVFTTIYAKHIYPHFKIARFDREQFDKIRNFLKYSSLQYLFAFFIGHIDGIILSRYLGLTSLGYYNFCLKFYTAIHGLIASLFKILFPVMSKFHGSGDYKKLFKMVKKSMFLTLAFSVSIFTAIVLLWKPVIAWYAGFETAKSTYALMIVFGMILIVRSLDVVYYYVFNSMAYPKIFIYSTIIVAVITNSLYFVLIPLFQEFGMVAATLIAYIFATGFISYFYVFKILKKPTPVKIIIPEPEKYSDSS